MQPATQPQVHTLERRSEQRKPALMHAFVSDFDDLLDLKCVIRDISKKGCRIASSYVEDLPTLVRITPEGFEKPLVGKVIWRNAKFAGIQFVTAAEAEALKVKQKVEPTQAAAPSGFFAKLFSFSTLRRKSGQVQRGDEREPVGLPSYGARALNAVRQPLESIKHLLGLLLGDAIRPIPRRAKTIINTAQRNASEAETLLEEALHADNIATGRMPCKMAPLEIVEFVQDAVLMATGAAAKYNVRYEVDAAIDQAQVSADATRMREVITNMLYAAARHSPVGELVTVSIARANGMIRVSVKDKGIVGEALHGDADGKHVPHPGDDDNGLGFDVARAILKQHDADLHVETTSTQSTIAWFELPEHKS